MLEALASGCHVVASDTAPVREVLEPLDMPRVGIFDGPGIAGAVLDALERRPDTTAAVAAMRSKYAHVVGLSKVERIIGIAGTA